MESFDVLLIVLGVTAAGAILWLGQPAPVTSDTPTGAAGTAGIDAQMQTIAELESRKRQLEVEIAEARAVAAMAEEVQRLREELRRVSRED